MEKLEQSTAIDSIVMYLIVRKSLGMSVGKVAAQCGHAVQMLTVNYFDLENQARNNPAPVLAHLTSQPPLSIFEAWLKNDYTKIVLGANENEWEKIKCQLKDIVIVRDNGLTEVAPNTETVIGIPPMLKSSAPKVIKKLQVLK